MPDQLPPDFPTPDRDAVVEAFKRDVRFYSNGAYSTEEGTPPDVDARVLADQLVPGYLQLRRSADNLVLGQATGAAAEAWALANGLPGRIPATGARGYIVLSAATGGTTLFEGDELKVNGTQLRYRCTRTATFLSGQLVPIQGLDTGPSTNQLPGTKLTWTSPRPGCNAEAVVWADPNGAGLVGGRSQETDEEIQARVTEAKRNPPSAGNDAQIQALVKAAGVALGIPVQQAFTYPCILGPATTGIVFTVLPDQPGGSRLPSGDQINAIEAWVKEQLPGDDSLFFGTLTASPLDLALKVEWVKGAASWTDLAPWPAFYVGINAIVVKTITSPLVCSVGRTVGSYVGVTGPQVGQTLGVYDANAKVFRRKRIAAVTGTGPWGLTFDGTAEASDTTYTPVVGQRVCPWSESLNLLVAPLLAEFERFGPGEQVATFFDAGTRQRRQPPPQRLWPSRVGSRVINGVQDLAAVNDASLADPLPEDLPVVTPVGAPGTLSYLRTLRYLAAFPIG